MAAFIKNIPMQRKVIILGCKHIGPPCRGKIAMKRYIAWEFQHKVPQLTFVWIIAKSN